MTTFALTPLGRLMYDLGPIKDGVFTNLLPLLAPLAPTDPPEPAPRRTTRPLAVRIAEEETRLARRLGQHGAAYAALVRSIKWDVPDRAAAMLRAADAHRENQRMDAALARYVAAQHRVDVAASRVQMSHARLDRLLDRLGA